MLRKHQIKENRLHKQSLVISPFQKEAFSKNYSLILSAGKHDYLPKLRKEQSMHTAVRAVEWYVRHIMIG